MPTSNHGKTRSTRGTPTLTFTHRAQLLLDALALAHNRDDICMLAGCAPDTRPVIVRTAKVRGHCIVLKDVVSKSNLLLGMILDPSDRGDPMSDEVLRTNREVHGVAEARRYMELWSQ